MDKMSKQELLNMLNEIENTPALALDDKLSGMPVYALMRLRADLPSNAVLLLDYPEITVVQVNALNRLRLVVNGVIEYKTKAQRAERGLD